MERANLKPNHLGIPALIPVMAQHKFLSWPPPLLNLLPVLLPGPVFIACPPLAGLTGSPVGVKHLAVLHPLPGRESLYTQDSEG